jgi:hypothetical protein
VKRTRIWGRLPPDPPLKQGGFIQEKKNRSRHLPIDIAKSIHYIENIDKFASERPM